MRLGYRNTVWSGRYCSLGVLSSQVLGYIKRGARLWCVMLLFEDFVGWIHGFKFSYLEYILDEGIIIVEYLFSCVICRLWSSCIVKWFLYNCWKFIWYMIYLLTVIVLTPGGSSTVHIYTQTIHRTQWKQNIQNRTYITIKIHNLQN
jgi:hypothetical protein